MDPRRTARLAGAFYLATIIAGLFAEFSRDTLIASGNPAVTAHNILAAEALYRWSFAADLVAGACYLVVTVLLYELLKPVNRTVSLLAALFSVIGIAVGAAGGVAQLGVLIALGNAPYLGAFDAAQLQTLAYVAGRLHAEASLIGLVFFGIYCALVGYLVFASGFLPKIIGILMQIGGACYLINSFAGFLAPAVANVLSPWIVLPSLIGELALMFWLLVAGVDAAKWKLRVDSGQRTEARGVVP